MVGKHGSGLKGTKALFIQKGPRLCPAPGPSITRESFTSTRLTQWSHSEASGVGSAPHVSGSTCPLLKHVFFSTVAPVTRPISCEAPQPTGQGYAQFLRQSACLSWPPTLIWKMGVKTIASQSLMEVILAESGQGRLSTQCKAQAASRKISVSPLQAGVRWGMEQGESDLQAPCGLSRAPPGSLLNNQGRKALWPVLPLPPEAPSSRTPACFPSLHS